MRRSWRVALTWALLGVAGAAAADGNRLTYLDGSDPYYVGRSFPRLVTPQWIGEPGVEAAIVLAIDDMRGHERWEQYLRPILDRLKRVDGRAPLSIMTCQIDPAQPHLQTWLREGLSLEVHTIDHPCPCLAESDFAKAKSTYDRCVELMFSVPGNRPVAFRMPCCDSLNTVSPRFFAEVFNRTTPAGKFLAIDSSVFNLATADDASVPRALVLDDAGAERFQKYLPADRTFVNTIEDYPYPYVIGRLCWEFPCAVPSDWSAQHLQKPANPRTVADLKAALDIAVGKQGVFDLVFHPYDWIRAEQVVEIVDHALAHHGGRVRFLSFRDALARLEKNLLDGRSLRTAQGGDAGVRLLDIDDDGFVDVLLPGERGYVTRLWQPATRTWHTVELPAVLADGKRVPAEALRFGVVDARGTAAVVFATEAGRGAFQFRDGHWHALPALADWPAVGNPPEPVLTLGAGRDRGLRLHDLDGDGLCECLVSNERQQAVWRWHAADRRWQALPWHLPAGTAIVTAGGGDAGLRLVDVDDDGHDDALFSGGERYSLHLFDSLEKGWSTQALAGEHGQSGAIPMIVRPDGTSGGVWFHSLHLFAQTEDTARLKDLVDRRSFGELLRQVEPRARAPRQALRSLRARPGMRVELMAAEPLTMDPVALAWGPDGKLWVAEMADYPRGVNGPGTPGGRVRFLEDADGDGRYDRSTLFLDGLKYPNGVAPWRDGVLVTAAPDILWARDTDGDGRADRREVLFHGLAEGNPQHRANGLKWGLDGWLYCANGDSGGRVRSLKTGQQVDLGGRDFRIQPDEGRIELVTGMSQFGRNRDDWGNWFGSNNANPMYHFVLEDHYLARNAHVVPPAPQVDVPVAPGTAPVFPRSRTLPRFNDLHTANRFTSACSAIVYRDDLLGEHYAGNVFVCEPVHNLVHREVMQPAGVTFSSRRAADEAAREFLASTDNWFRPVMVETGPDGGLWIVDMYRAVIEHPEWIPRDWQQRLDLRAGHDRGRIYRVLPIERPARAAPRLDRLSDEQLVAALESPNGPRRDLAQQLLVWRGAKGVEPALARLAASSSLPQCRVQALATLDTLQLLAARHVLAALKDAHPGVRRWAIRLSERLLDREPELGAALVTLLDDADPQVQLQLACSLGAWHDERAGQALGRLAARRHDQPLLVAAALSSVGPKNVDAVLAASLQHSGPAGPAPALVAQLAGLALTWDRQAALGGALAKLTAPDRAAGFADWQLAGMAGLLEALERRRLGVEKLAADPTALASVFEFARAESAREAADTPRRVLAARLLGRRSEDRQADLAALAALLVPQAPGELQSAAAAALARIDDPRAPEALLAGWRGHAPALREQILEGLLSRSAGVEALLARLEARQVAAADLGSTRRARLLRLPDAGLRARAERALAGAIDANRQQVIDALRGVLDAPGDAAAGAAVFAKRCAACHRLRDQGHAVGPDLAALTDNSPQSLLVAILDPNRAVETKFLEYTAATGDGRTLTGMLAAETATSITLLGQENRQQTLLRNEIETLQASGRSLMPEGIEKDLAPRELADVIAYVRSTGPPRKEFPLSRPELVAGDAQGRLALLATNCEIHGATLVLEEKYRNLGFWSSPNDRAVWNLDVPRSGAYAVELDYACDDSVAGNRLAIEVGSQRVAVAVQGTGSWDDYRHRAVAKLQLQAGRQQLVMGAQGPVRGALLDLRGATLRLLEK